MNEVNCILCTKRVNGDSEQLNQCQWPHVCLPLLLSGEKISYQLSETLFLCLKIWFSTSHFQ